VNDGQVDVLVVGGGAAGLSVATGLASARRVLLVDAGDGSTRWAQGGIAAAFAHHDDPLDHAADTRVAGDGLCDARALDSLVEEGPQCLADLVALGARFDRAPDGRLAGTLEGGHRTRRIVHAGGDATGAEVARVLGRAADAAGVRRVRGHVKALSLGLGPLGRQVTGGLVVVGDRLVPVRARAVVLATGGIGHAYATTTNPVGVDGAGIALALLAGASLVDVEFVQFHPTALYTGRPDGQQPLVSEAVRGEGAVLRDDAGRRLMHGRHPLADLAPRDVVAREVHQETTRSGRPHVWLDATGVPRVTERFPGIAASCAAHGFDLASEPVPVAPAAHFLCGGVATDRWGATDVAGLYAVGEVAGTGVHGANRLASNSLLEALVFGRRVASRLVLDLPADATYDDGIAELVPDRAAEVAARAALTTHAGVLRDAAGLAEAERLLGSWPMSDPTWLVASSVVAAAAARRETRGCHTRSDHPLRDDGWRRRVRVRLDESGQPRVTVSDPLARAA
jgi:L-aspartate oxidase